MERRELLFAPNGGVWAHPNLITYSFAPDGTNVGGQASTLFQTLNAYYPTATWQQQFQKAAAVWEAVANINLTQVSDNGEPIGAVGNQQGDPNVGDIRIGATPQQNSQLAFTFLPPPYNGGTDAGDMFLNSNEYWGSGGFDVETVAIHEFGHALGLDHSQITQAVMYAYYNAVKQNLNLDDILGIQSIYGGTALDSVPNATFATATDLTPQLNGQGQAAIGNLATVTAGDSDWYKVTVPANTTGTFTVVGQSANFSSLSPKLTVFNASDQGLAQAAAPYSYGATDTVTINGVMPGQVYYFRASAANGGPSAIGGYSLLLTFGAAPLPPAPVPNTATPSQPDQGGGSSYLDTGTGTVYAGSGVSGAPLSGVSPLPASSLWGAVGGPASSLTDVVGKLNDDGQGHGKVGVGSLVGWGDALMISPRFLHHGARMHHRPPSHHPHAGVVPWDTHPSSNSVVVVSPVPRSQGASTALASLRTHDQAVAHLAGERIVGRHHRHHHRPRPATH